MGTGARRPAPLVIGALIIGGIAGALVSDGRDSSATDTGAEPVVERIAFRSGAGVSEAPILDLGGLGVRAWCRDYGRRIPEPYLSVAAETAFDDTIAAVAFSQKKGADQSAYTFVQSDFDRAYGPWDFLGTNPDKTVGTLHYARPDGGQVEVRFLADQGTAQGDCVFAGTATYLPAGSDDVSASGGVSDGPTARADPTRRRTFECPGEGVEVDPTDNLVCSASIRPGDAGFERCRPGGRGGGYDVWIRGVACAEIRESLATFGGNPDPERSPFFATEQRWACWSRSEGRYGPVHNICFRDGQVVMYKFA